MDWKSILKFDPLTAESLLGEIFIGRNYSSGEIFVTKPKIRHFKHTIKVSLQYLHPSK